MPITIRLPDDVHDVLTARAARVHDTGSRLPADAVLEARDRDRT